MIFVHISDCLYCGADKFDPLYPVVRDRLKISFHAWAFLRCQSCNSAILSPRPSNDQLAYYYPEDYLFTPKSNHELIGKIIRWIQQNLFYRFTRPNIISYLNKHSIANNPQKSLLDVGCGKGALLNQYVQQGFEVHAIDFSQTNIAYIKTIPGVHAYCAGTNQLDSLFSAEQFDFILAFHVLEHTPNPISVLNTCHNLLKSGGELILVVPVIDSIFAKIFGSKWAAITEAPRHLTLPSRKGLELALLATRFKNIRIKSSSIIDSAGFIALSLLPQSSEAFQHDKDLTPKILRLLAGFLVLAFIPLVWIESYICKRPAIVTIHAAK